MKKEPFSLRARMASFRNAWKGLSVFVRQEHNAWIHLSMTVLVILAGVLFRISTYEWIAVVFAIGLVISAEAINSAIERLADVVQPNRDERIRDVKDICAGAVLVCAMTAFVIGLIVFLPKLLAFLFGN
ncbi:MAG: diacylglycerol kinase family protein [Bacteroidales bacterium]|nr:diacylglycerol kinase family protein [Bacteroidales bacterium]MBR1794469.1 diacylglycerol kinase family protein [Bacteroidales bacterium]